jgi:ligand-binding sensor domain-containing protein/signal transduction histidine kinase
VIIGYAITFAGPASALDPGKKLSQCVHRAWTARNGLPTGDLQAITQTGDGYLWIGTEEGLARFDGWRFRIFDKASGQLPGNFIFSLLEDSSGSLWIGTNGGLVRYKQGRFETIGKEAGLINTFVYGITQDRAGTLWISANYKLWRYRGNTFTSFDPLKEQKDLGQVIDVTVDKSDTVWVVLKGGIVCRFRDNHFEPVPEFAALRGQALERISADSEGGIWISNFSGGAYCYRDGEIKAFGPNEGLLNVPTSRAIQSRDGSVWLGTDSGVARINGDKCAVFKSNGKDALGMVNAVYEDREGNLWTGASGKGLQRFSDGSFTPFGPEEGLPNGSVKGVCEDSDHNLWLGTSDGIYRGRDRFNLVLSAKDRLGGDLIFVQLVADPRDHSLWIGTMHDLFHYQYETEILDRYTKKDGLPSDGVLSLCLDHQGRLWVGCDAGLVCLKDGRFTLPEGLQSLTRGKTVRALAEDHEGGIWIGTSSGPILYKQGAITQVGKNDGLGTESCRTIFVTSNGAVWISFWNGGLALCTGKGCFTYRQGSGLPIDDISGLIDDPVHGDLWLGTVKGVFRISEQQLKDFRLGRVQHVSRTFFDESDGLNSPGIPDDGKPVITRADDGKLWWSTDEGAAVVNPDNLTLHDAPGPTLIESVIADNRTVDEAKPELYAGTRRLEIEYASLTYAAADKIQFRYRLDGIDREWFDAGQHREAVFTNLGHGLYRFRVQASADEGASWTEPGAEFAFYVRPHFYETWWFFAFCAAVVGCMLWLIFVLRRRRLEARFRAVISERVRVAGEIHDSLAQGFASAAMLLDSLDRLVPEDSALRLRLKSMRHILGTSLSDARAMIATLRGQPPENEDLELALRKLVGRLEPISPAPITLDFGEERLPIVSMRVRQELMRICQEGINNAVRHANPKHIWVTVRGDDGEYLRLTIQDDGRGFDVGAVTGSLDNTHFGLITLSERAKRLEGKLEIRSQLGSGTEVELLISLARLNGGDKSPSRNSEEVERARSSRRRVQQSPDR